MMKIRYILFVAALLSAVGASAQKEARDYIRKGNRQYKDSMYADAEISYKKAYEIDSLSSIVRYNYGNSLVMQKKEDEAMKKAVEEAMRQYVEAAAYEKDKMKLAQIYHNMGVLCQAGKDYAKAVDAYKKSLRNNPKDDETRYNLALAQKMLKEGGSNNNDDKDKDKDKDKNKDEQQKQKEDQKQNKDEQKQQQKQKQDQMSKENAEQLLNAVMQDEKDVQDKVKKQQRLLQHGQLEKDW